jgi:hypothetical protein
MDIVDPAQKTWPTSRRLAAMLRAILQRQLAEVLQRLKRERQAPPLDHWTGPIVDATMPILGPQYVQGAREAARRLARLRARKAVRKAAGMEMMFDLVNPMVAEQVRRMVFDFASSTNATSRMRVAEAIEWLRRALAQGIDERVALAEMTRRVQRIFADPQRAATIAITESSRAMHGGQFLAAKQSDIVTGKRWLASSDACPLCLALNGKEVELDEDFAVDPGGGPYARIPYPPRHPNCFCTWVEVIG